MYIWILEEWKASRRVFSTVYAWGESMSAKGASQKRKKKKLIPKSFATVKRNTKGRGRFQAGLIGRQEREMRMKRDSHGCAILGETR